MTKTYPGNRPIDREEMIELAVMVILMTGLTAAGTWIAALLGVPVGWRLAAGASGALLVVAALRLMWLRKPPTWRWLGAIIVIWVLIALVNWTADVRFW